MISKRSHQAKKLLNQAKTHLKPIYNLGHPVFPGTISKSKFASTAPTQNPDDGNMQRTYLSSNSHPPNHRKRTMDLLLRPPSMYRPLFLLLKIHAYSRGHRVLPTARHKLIYYLQHQCMRGSCDQCINTADSWYCEQHECAEAGYNLERRVYSAFCEDISACTIVVMNRMIGAGLSAYFVKSTVVEGMNVRNSLWQPWMGRKVPRVRRQSYLDIIFGQFTD